MSNILQHTAVDTRDDFFTKPEIISKCVELVRARILEPLMRKGKQLLNIDSSAGTNQFSVELGIPYVAFDLFTTNYPVVYGNVSQQDWLQTSARSMPWLTDYRRDGRHLLSVSLNPPFGIKHRLIDAFIQHAVGEFQPDFMFWIVPINYQLPPQISPWYDLIHVEPLASDAFYRPLTGIEQGGLMCEFRIYARRDTYNRQQGATTKKNETKRVREDPCPGVTITPLDKTDLSFLKQNPFQTLLVQKWGRAAGRRFLESQSDGSLLSYDKDATDPDAFYPSIEDFMNKKLPGSYAVMFFDEDTLGSLNRPEFRKQWIPAWYDEMPHSFDPRNSVVMNCTQNTCHRICRRLYNL